MEKPLPCGKYIKRISDELRKNANNSMRARDLTMAQLSALLELEELPEGQCTLKELEQKLHVAQSTAAGIIARLEQKGFVEGLGDDADRRIKLVRITEAGNRQLQTARQEMDQAEAQLLSGLTEAEQSIFRTLLQKVYNSLS